MNDLLRNRVPFEYLALLLCVFMMMDAHAQSNSNISIAFVPKYEDASLVLNHPYYRPSKNDTVLVTTFKCYISNIEFYHGKRKLYAEEESFHLLNVDDPGSLNLVLNGPDPSSITQMTFDLGIDSLTSVSGVFGGDLDPTHGMYWTWQSGYINCKLEGMSTNCPARNQVFQFHIGGYRHPYNTLQHVAIDLTQTHTTDIEIQIAVDKILSEINLQEDYQVMSPDQKAVEIARLLSAMFSAVESK